MLNRIYTTLQGKDNRSISYLKSFSSLDINGRVTDIQIVDSYLISHQNTIEVVKKIAEALTNPILEKYSIDNITEIVKKFTYLIEISFLPGVTDNVGHTAKETILDLLHLKESSDIEVFSSKIFLFKGNLNKTDIEKIANSLHNSLIEKASIYSLKEIIKTKNLPLIPPIVNLKNKNSILTISLDVKDEELKNIGERGIQNKDGSRNGPLALSLNSMKIIKEYFDKLGRNPTDIELESIAQTWSEHCKHTIFANPIDEIKEGLYKTYIKGATNEIRKKKGKNDFCVSVFHDNAGGVIFDDNFLITHKVETHNSPSALDPYGGAITGIGGVNRDAIGFGLGAKPVANTYGFCVGNIEDKKVLFLDKNKKQKMFPPKRILDGVIKGINSGGNCAGIPTLNGFLKFDDRYRGKPLVFAGTVGLIPRKIHGKYSHEKKAEPGDYVVVVGGRVGADGIHGATFSSVAMDSGSPATAVQIGDPITQKKLSDALIKEARDMNLYNSITDNGAGGISCSVAEMARESGGVKVNLEKVPLKYQGLEPWQIWISESQERMTLSVPKKKWNVFNRLMETRGVEATIIGEFTSEKKCIVYFENKKIMDIDMDFLHNGLPKNNLFTKIKEIKYAEPILITKKNYTQDLLALLNNNNLSGFSFVSEQYDHEVQASSVLKPLSGRGRINTDAQVFHPVLHSKKGAVLSSALFPSYGDISTYHMSACAIDTTIRNIIASGGNLKHLSILDNFCWCSSNDPERLWQLKESVRACYDYAVGYSTPFISGKDSMFNDFKGYDEKGNKVDISIPPTLLISGISVVENILKTVSPEFKNTGDLIYVLGETKDELGGGDYLKILGYTGNNVPKVEINKNLKTYKILEELIAKEILSSSLSISSGGLAIALAKASVGGMIGSNITIDNIKGLTTVQKLFSESQGRILVSINPKKCRVFEKIVKNIPHNKLGIVTKNNKFIISDKNKKILETSVQNLSTSYHKFSNKMK